MATIDAATGLPATVRLPSRYTTLSGDLEGRPRAVDPVAVSNAFAQWDRTGDGRINPSDIVVFAQKNNLQPPMGG